MHCILFFIIHCKFNVIQGSNKVAVGIHVGTVIVQYLPTESFV